LDVVFGELDCGRSRGCAASGDNGEQDRKTSVHGVSQWHGPRGDKFIHGLFTETFERGIRLKGW